VERVGGPGSVQHTKMTNQILIATNMIGVVEGNMSKGSFEILKDFRNFNIDSGALLAEGRT
jgi:hypothetical protein